MSYAMTAQEMEYAEAALLSLPQVEIPTHTYILNGLLIREGIVPAGVFAMGHRHKYRHLNLLLKGAIALRMDDGIRIVRAPEIWVAEPGRKAAFFLEETVWLNVLHTDEEDVGIAQEIVVEKTDTWKKIAALAQEHRICG